MIVAMPTKSRVATGATVAVAVAMAAIGATVWARREQAPPPPRAETVAVETVTIERTDLSTSRTLRGSLGYGPPRVVNGGREGVVTALPPTGRIMKRNSVMFRVNDEPVPLFYGAPPLYRVLGQPGTVGRDVAMIRRNLRALGYPTGRQPRPAKGVLMREGEAVLTPDLLKAVKRWQRDVGMTEDGVLQVGDVVVLPASVRVDAVAVAVGDDAAGPLLEVTNRTKVVTSQVNAPEARSLKAGTKVTLRMPDGTDTPGKVTGVATVATTREGQPQGGPQQVAITIQPSRPVAFDGGDVEIKVIGQTRRNVLAVPVNVLVALREGGYAVQLPDNSLRPVKTGLFAMGMVEISGDGLDEGLDVVTTS